MLDLWGVIVITFSSPTKLFIGLLVFPGLMPKAFMKKIPATILLDDGDSPHEFCGFVALQLLQWHLSHHHQVGFDIFLHQTKIWNPQKAIYKSNKW